MPSSNSSVSLGHPGPPSPRQYLRLSAPVFSSSTSSVSLDRPEGNPYPTPTQGKCTCCAVQHQQRFAGLPTDLLGDRLLARLQLLHQCIRGMQAAGSVADDDVNCVVALAFRRLLQALRGAWQKGSGQVLISGVALAFRCLWQALPG